MMKYNWSIIGHEKQLEALEQDIDSGKLAHAYLLSGPGSVGKATVAKKLAGILQCEKDFCHKCPACIQVEKGCHIDTIELIDDGESIKIEEVRKLIERLSMTPQAPYKILLIQNIERMTSEAANSFLKTLEEPPPRTIFIITTNNIRALLPTVVSRVRVIKFNSVSDKYLQNFLKENYPESDEETIKKVSLFSLGKTGKALQLMDSPEVLASYLEIYHKVQNFLSNRSLVERFAYVEELVADEPKLSQFFEVLLNVLRSKLLASVSEENIKPEQSSLAYADLLSKIEEAGILLKRNVNARLVLENLMISL
ncbi:DNA polymerase III subunit [Candidatus Peregrinibacteria bacterium]|nr:DNA polymerase III subunit [Candidatus Peregrinibacteria bacterium]